MPSKMAAEEWQPVCRLLELEVGRGVTALVHGQALAIFRLDDVVFALGNHDPFLHASSMSKGIVGRAGEVPYVGSPVHGHRFDLRDGRCLDQPQACVPAYEVKIVDGLVLVGRRKATTHAHPA